MSGECGEWDVHAHQIISFSESLVSFLVGCVVKSDARSSQVSNNFIN
jgi:hypothetical protein